MPDGLLKLLETAVQIVTDSEVDPFRKVGLLGDAAVACEGLGGDPDTVSDWFERARRMADKLRKSDGFREYAIEGLSTNLARAGRVEQALATRQLIEGQEGEHSAKVIHAVAGSRHWRLVPDLLERHRRSVSGSVDVAFFAVPDPLRRFTAGKLAKQGEIDAAVQMYGDANAEQALSYELFEHYAERGDVAAIIKRLESLAWSDLATKQRQLRKAIFNLLKRKDGCTGAVQMLRRWGFDAGGPVECDGYSGDLVRVGVWLRINGTAGELPQLLALPSWTKRIFQLLDLALKCAETSAPATHRKLFLRDRFTLPKVWRFQSMVPFISTETMDWALDSVRAVDERIEMCCGGLDTALQCGLTNRSDEMLARLEGLVARIKRQRDSVPVRVLLTADRPDIAWRMCAIAAAPRLCAPPGARSEWYDVIGSRELGFAHGRAGGRSLPAYIQALPFDDLAVASAVIGIAEGSLAN